MEWSYGTTGIRSCKMGTYCEVEKGWWRFSRLVSVSNSFPKNVSLAEIIEQVQVSNKFEVDDYHLLHRNCWHFAAIVLRAIDSSMTTEHYLNLIYKINDFEWNSPVSGATWAAFRILQWGSTWSQFLSPILYRIMHPFDRLEA